MLIETTAELECQMNGISVLMENNQEFAISAASYAKNPNRLPQARLLSGEGNVWLQAAAETTCQEGRGRMLTYLSACCEGRACINAAAVP